MTRLREQLMKELFFLLIRNTDVGKCIEVRDPFMSIICMDFYGMEVDSISLAP